MRINGILGFFRKPYLWWKTFSFSEHQLLQVVCQLQLPKANWAQLRRAIIVFEVPILARELKSLQMSLNELKDGHHYILALEPYSNLWNINAICINRVLNFWRPLHSLNVVLIFSEGEKVWASSGIWIPFIAYHGWLTLFCVDLRTTTRAILYKIIKQATKQKTLVFSCHSASQWHSELN